MKAWSYFSILGITVLSLVSCSQTKTTQEIAEDLEDSVVLITYQDKTGHGTGFFVSEDRNNCSILTARHVVSVSEKLTIKTHDNKKWEVENARLFQNQDLALLSFEPQQNKCPYQALQLGDSDTVQRAQNIYISGFFKSGGQLVDHFVSGTITALSSLPDGYSIAYDARTFKGMSGSPVVNKVGEVIAVHGYSDVEITRLAEFPKTSSELQALEEIAERGARINAFKWGIPISLYLANIPQEKAKAIGTLSPEDYYNKGKDLNTAKKYQEAFEAHDKATNLKPDYADAWFGKGFALEKLDRDEEAIASYDKAIEINPDYDFAWNNRGWSLYNLGRYQEAIASYDRALEINPDYQLAINNRKLAVQKLNQ